MSVQDLGISSDTVWMLLAAMLVFFMQPGFALCEAGFTRSKNTANILFKNFVDFMIGSVLFWFGFNPGSQLAASGEVNRVAISHVFLTTNLAAVCGGLGTMFTSWIKYGKPSFSLTLNGILAGLVAITAGCDLVSPLGSAIIGLLAGIILVFSIEFIDTKLHIDDPVGASSVYGVCGIFGTLMTGLFALDGGAFYGGGFGLFGAQLFGIICIDLWAAATGIILFWGIKKICGLRVDKRIEEEGLEIYEHGESCYN